MANTDRSVNVVALLAFAVIATVAAPAGAHPEFAPNTVNRYVKFDLVSPTEIRLAYTIMVGATPAAALRRAADADGNGKVDGDESRAIGEQLRAATVAGVTLEVDGHKVTPPFAAPDVGLAGDDVAASPLSVDLIARVPLAAGAATHTVRFDDATPEPLLGETEVRLDESPTTRLIAAHRGPTGDERETKFLFRGPKFSALEDRSITFVFGPGAHAAAPVAATAPSLASRLRARAVSFVVFLVLAALFAGTFARTHRRRQRR